MRYREERLDVRGWQVRLLRGGEGPPLLYLHDTFTAAADLWLALHDCLASQYEVLVPVHPGCAGSDGTDIDSMEDMVFHYLDVCEVAGLDRPVLIGASLGGWVAAEIAVRHAGMLRGLILIDALGLRLPGVTTADILRLDPAQARQHLFADADAGLARHIVPDRPAQEQLPHLLQARHTLARFAWQFPDNPKLARYLYRVRVPTLIIWGEQDGLVPGAHGNAYRQGIPDATLHLVPQSGHLPHVEQPEVCTRLVIEFLNHVSPARA
jgi:pimeloyl-ACP methyl ester carboxylesterase